MPFYVMAIKSLIKNFHHIKFWVGNAKQAAEAYCVHFGFQPLAYRGLETGSRDVVSHAIIFVFESPLKYGNKEMDHHLTLHGDGVKDIALQVDDIEKTVQVILLHSILLYFLFFFEFSLFETAESNGADILEHIHEINDQHGQIRIASIKTVLYGDVIHTLIENVSFKGSFMPGFCSPLFTNPLLSVLPQPQLNFIDHVVGNQPETEMEKVVSWYERTLNLQRFWSIDDTVCHTEYSSLRSNLITNSDHSVQMAICEPAKGLRGVSQIQEFIDFYGSAGVQHIALHTDDIVFAVSALKQRGVQFLEAPATYYENLKAKLLQHSTIRIKEDLNMLQQLNILIDYDDNGYLLQIFTKPVQDRPTLFLEIIQRHNHKGFGVGNFKALFEALEMEQKRRGTLYYDSSELKN
ncbi:4-hydroxyphenylpyruvate dioxygenase [Trichinella sp. T9]|nr:4-hydroxyphenylpyruvate dioxygenase [Trichinella sp. T9]